MADRTSVPARCNARGVAYAANGYRMCEAHREPTDDTAGTFGTGRCDYPLDGLAAARLATRRAYESEARMIGAMIHPIVITA